jgi:hypothetical protein
MVNTSWEETMFPSGPWRGYWEQAGFGREFMHPLVLRFADGIVTGQGSDCVGPFTFEGFYNQDGSVTLVKQYLGQHAVVYQGTYDGEGTIAGRWSIAGLLTGPFALSPVVARPGPDAPIQSLE